MYYLIVYQISVERKVHGVSKFTDTLLPVLYDINSRSVVDNEELVEHIFSRSQTEGKEYNAKNSCRDEEMIQDMQYDFAEALDTQKKQKLAELKLQVESDSQRNEKQTIEYYQTMISNQERFISGWEADIESNFDNLDETRIRQLHGAIRLARARIVALQNEKEERLNRIHEDSFIEINEDIVSLNLINII